VGGQQEIGNEPLAGTTLQPQLPTSLVSS
jgi:hypothetical protein